MCLAIPGEILDMTDEDALTRTARVRVVHVTRPVHLAPTRDARVGDYVLVHVGCAISVLAPERAQEILATLDEIAQLDASTPAPPDRRGDA